MKARVVKAVGRTRQRCDAVHVSLVLRNAAEGSRSRTASTLEQVDHWILLRRNLARLKLDKFRRLAEPGQFLSDFMEFFSRCQDELVSSDDYQALRRPTGFASSLPSATRWTKTHCKERAEHVALQQEIARAYRASEEILREKSALSFG